MSFPSPCITSTRQLTDQSSTSHPSSPPSPSPGPAKPAEADPSIAMLKQYYLDCILKIDPNHPVGQTFPKVSHIENKHKVVNNSANILRNAMDQKFSFDLTNKWMIKVWIIKSVFSCRRQGGEWPVLGRGRGTGPDSEDPHQEE